MEDFLRGIMHLDYVDCFVQMAEIKYKLNNMSDEKLTMKVGTLSMGSEVSQEVEEAVAEFFSNSKLSPESRESLYYYVLNHESFTALCTCDEKEVAVFI